MVSSERSLFDHHPLLSPPSLTPFSSPPIVPPFSSPYPFPLALPPLPSGIIFAAYPIKI